jgi:hypothetical protein
VGFDKRAPAGRNRPAARSTRALQVAYFTGNQAVGGNGGSAAITAKDYDISFGYGGGIFNGNAGVVVVRGSTFSHNQAMGGSDGKALFGRGHVGDGSGGGLLNVNGGTMTLTDSTFDHNESHGGNNNVGASSAEGGSGAFIVGWGMGGAITNEGWFDSARTTLIASNRTLTHNRVAQHLLDLRADDGASATVTYTPGSDPGDWQLTPPLARPPLVPHWGSVTPFTMTSGDQFRPEGPPALTSAAYTTAFNEVKILGAASSTVRTAEQTEIARFWADSSVPHWNKIAATVSTAQDLTLAENARLFALMNLATADAYISSFEAKYVFDFWQPITAIRAAETDGNPDTLADPSWEPLIVNPQMPAYASGHSTFGGAAAVVLAGFFGSDDIAFTSTSDFIPGVTRSFTSFSEAADENARSRLLAGIHWSFDNVDGMAAGRALGAYVVDKFLTPAPGPDDLAATGGRASEVHRSLRAGQVQPLLIQAQTGWRAADLVNGLDDNAAGWGWFVNRSPRTDTESTRHGNQCERNRMDLLSTLTHDSGHLLGADHDAGAMMQETLDAMGLGELADPFGEKE